MKKLFVTLLTLCTLLSFGGCTGAGIFPNRAEREIAAQLIYTQPEPDRLHVTGVLAYDPERYTYYVEFASGTVFALAPGSCKPALRLRGEAVRCDAERINRELLLGGRAK